MSSLSDQLRFQLGGLILVVLACSLLSACGGGGGGGGGKNSVSSSTANDSASAVSSSSPLSSSPPSSTPPSSSQSSAGQSSSAQSSLASSQVTIAGTITYDYVPTNNSYVGLNYAATEVRPARGVSVELVNSANVQLAQTVTDEQGGYALKVAANTQVKVRVRAELVSNQAPTWNFEVKDNTGGNALYVLTGALASSGTEGSTRDLHAASGWDGSAYSATRAAAPFAILDDIYTALMRFHAVGNQLNFPLLTFYWSPNNRPADGDKTLGEISTSFFDSSSAIYLLGAADSDTDEYDAHVILHEWGHYIESKLSRADTIGGNHPSDAKLDLRLAMSEGYASAFAAMLLDDPIYTDSSGTGQASGFYFNVSNTNHAIKGWYGEASIDSIIYNYYTQGADRDFSYIYAALTSANYINTPGPTSIYSFANELKTRYPATATLLDNLMQGQNIYGTGIYGESELNGGGRSGAVLPVVPQVPVGGSITRCSTNAFFTANSENNTLGVFSFAHLSLSSGGSYSISVTRNSATTQTTNPDFYLYKNGVKLASAESSSANTETLTQNLSAGAYLIEVVDDKNRLDDIGNGDSCFDLSVQQN